MPVAEHVADPSVAGGVVRTLKLALAWLEGLLGAGLMILAIAAFHLENLTFTVAACSSGALLLSAGWTLTRHPVSAALLQVAVIIVLCVWGFA
jgi:hypothetical protein